MHVLPTMHLYVQARCLALTALKSSDLHPLHDINIHLHSDCPQELLSVLCIGMILSICSTPLIRQPLVEWQRLNAYIKSKTLMKQKGCSVWDEHGEHNMECTPWRKHNLITQ